MEEEEQKYIFDGSKDIYDIEGADPIPTKLSGLRLKATWDPSPFPIINGLWFYFEDRRYEEPIVPVGFPVTNSPNAFPATACFVDASK